MSNENPNLTNNQLAELIALQEQLLQKAPSLLEKIKNIALIAFLTTLSAAIVASIFSGIITLYLTRTIKEREESSVEKSNKKINKNINNHLVKKNYLQTTKVLFLSIF